MSVTKIGIEMGIIRTCVVAVYLRRHLKQNVRIELYV